MAKRPGQRKKSTAMSEATSSAEQEGIFEGIGRRIDALPKVQAAERLVRQAQEELQRAQAHCENVRATAARQLSDLGEATASDALQSSLDYVRRHPAQAVLGSVALGYLLGRLFKR